uniref:Thrombopoietin n=1 Tax=Sphaeramia orbicularis TaxID=375764 RepID=A0A673CB05_9TELE
TGHFSPGLLLLLWMVASEVWDVETRPIDFVCSRASRKALNIVAEMETISLPLSVKLPCTGLHIASWENKSHQEKRGDIVASLQLLTEGVRAVKVLSRPGCGTSLLQRLENNINNYLLILTHLELSVRSSHSNEIWLFSVILQYFFGTPAAGIIQFFFTFFFFFF